MRRARLRLGVALASLAAGIAGAALLGAESPRARADQAAVLDAATARRAAALLAPGTDFVAWTCPGGSDLALDEPPSLYRIREVLVHVAPAHVEVRVVSRLLATAAAPAEADASGGPSAPTGTPAPAYAWSVAPARPAETAPLDLAYVFVPDPGEPGRFRSLAGLIGIEADLAAREIRLPRPLLRTVGTVWPPP